MLTYEGTELTQEEKQTYERLKYNVNTAKRAANLNKNNHTETVLQYTIKALMDFEEQNHVGLVRGGDIYKVS
jgi:hypothetical protein